MTATYQPGDLLEIKVHRDWLKVTGWIFRSWTGDRRVNGVAYTGPVYVLHSDTEYRP